MATRPLRGGKSKGETPTRGVCIGSTVSHLSTSWFREPVEWCCSCTWHSAYSTTGLFARVCKCCNCGRQHTVCYCWGRCKNRGQLMPSPTTERGMLGHFPRGADPPAIDQRSSTPPVRSPTSLSLRAISSAGAGGGGRGAERDDAGARGTAWVGEADQGGETGTAEGRRAARRGGK